MFESLAMVLVLAVLDQPNDQSVGERVGLNVRITSQRHCRSVEDSAITWIDLKLSVAVLNTTRSPVIVRGGGALDVLGFVISQPGRRPLEVPVGHRTTFTEDDLTRGAATPGAAGFVVIGPGETYLTTASTGIPLDLVELGAVSSGTADLVFELASWNELDEVTRVVQERWRRSGTLWTGGATAPPVTIQLAQGPTVPCKP